MLKKTFDPLTDGLPEYMSPESTPKIAAKIRKEQKFPGKYMTMYGI